MFYKMGSHYQLAPITLSLTFKYLILIPGLPQTHQQYKQWLINILKPKPFAEQSTEYSIQTKLGTISRHIDRCTSAQLLSICLPPCQLVPPHLISSPRVSLPRRSTFHFLSSYWPSDLYWSQSDTILECLRQVRRNEYLQSGDLWWAIISLLVQNYQLSIQRHNFTECTPTNAL